jgi:hypothetical protein
MSFLKPEEFDHCKMCVRGVACVCAMGEGKEKFMDEKIFMLW